MNNINEHYKWTLQMDIWNVNYKWRLQIDINTFINKGHAKGTSVMNI